MAVSAGFADMLCDVLEPLGPIAVRKMFGGAGVFAGGIMFAILDGECLYFKTDDAGIARFEAEGMRPFTYVMKTGEGTLHSYWRVPDRLLDEPSEMVEWAGRAIAVARASARAAIKSKRPVKTSAGRSRKGEKANSRSSPKIRSKRR